MDFFFLLATMKPLFFVRNCLKLSFNPCVIFFFLLWQVRFVVWSMEKIDHSLRTHITLKAMPPFFFFPMETTVDARDGITFFVWANSVLQNAIFQLLADYKMLSFCGVTKCAWQSITLWKHTTCGLTVHTSTI